MCHIAHLNTQQWLTRILGLFVAIHINFNTCSKFIRLVEKNQEIEKTFVKISAGIQQ